MWVKDRSEGIPFKPLVVDSDQHGNAEFPCRDRRRGLVVRESKSLIITKISDFRTTLPVVRSCRLDCNPETPNPAVRCHGNLTLFTGGRWSITISGSDALHRIVICIYLAPTGQRRELLIIALLAHAGRFLRTGTQPPNVKIRLVSVPS